MLWKVLSIILVLLTFSPELLGRNIKNCGRKISGTGLVVNGTASKAHYWPWMVALLNLDEDYKFFCAGNLVTTKNVISGEFT